MKRSAKLVQGTNSNFIWMPVSAVKSLDSSASALAGSQAAQQSVSCLSCACATVAPSAKVEAATIRASFNRIIVVLPVLHPCGCGLRAATMPDRGGRFSELIELN